MSKIKPIPKAVKKKKEKISTWKKKCDTKFSKFIRKRDADFWWNCISCWKYIPYERWDAWHFIPRNCIALRYDEKNVNFQCWRCNRYNDWEQALQYIGINKKYWEWTADELLDIYKKYKHDVKQYWIDFYKEIYERYKHCK